MMGPPILRNHIDLNIARARFLLAELENGPVEIRPGAVIPKTGMKHANRLAIARAEIITAKALVVPDVLQQAFGRMRRITFAQESQSLLLRAPLRVRVRPESGHGPWFPSVRGQSQAASGVDPPQRRIPVFSQPLANASNEARMSYSRDRIWDVQKMRLSYKSGIYVNWHYPHCSYCNVGSANFNVFFLLCREKCETRTPR
jgi:hypothetical protein